MSTKPFRTSPLKTLLLTCAVVVAVSGLERVGHCEKIATDERNSPISEAEARSNPDRLAQCAYGKTFDELTPLEQGRVLGPFGPQGFHSDCVADREHADQVREQQRLEDEALLQDHYEEIAQAKHGKSYGQLNIFMRALVRGEVDNLVAIRRDIISQEVFHQAYDELDDTSRARVNSESMTKTRKLKSEEKQTHQEH